MTSCRICGEEFDDTGTKHGIPADTWALLAHLREEHGEP